MTPFEFFGQTLKQAAGTIPKSLFLTTAQASTELARITNGISAELDNNKLETLILRDTNDHASSSFSTLADALMDLSIEHWNIQQSGLMDLCHVIFLQRKTGQLQLVDSHGDNVAIQFIDGLPDNLRLPNNQDLNASSLYETIISLRPKEKAYDYSKIYRSHKKSRRLLENQRLFLIRSSFDQIRNQTWTSSTFTGTKISKTQRATAVARYALLDESMQDQHQLARLIHSHCHRESTKTSLLTFSSKHKLSQSKKIVHTRLQQLLQVHFDRILIESPNHRSFFSSLCSGCVIVINRGESSRKIKRHITGLMKHGTPVLGSVFVDNRISNLDKH